MTCVYRLLRWLDEFRVTNRRLHVRHNICQLATVHACNVHAGLWQCDNWPVAGLYALHR